MPPLPSSEEERDPPEREEPAPPPSIPAPEREEEALDVGERLERLRVALEAEEERERRTRGDPSSKPGRRTEVTPRRVHISAPLTPRERESRRARGLSTDPDPDDIEEISLLSLQRALRAQTIKAEKLERDLKTARRMSTGRASLDSDGGERARSTIARPKLKEPPPFPTEYKETYNA